MKKMSLSHIVLAAVFFAVLASGCGREAKEENRSSRLTVTAGLPPVAYLARQIGGDRVRVISLLPEGRSPHDYAPGPQEIRSAALSKLFLTTGMTFEKTAAKPLSGSIGIVDVSAGIQRIPLEAEHAHEEHAEKHGHHHHHHHDDEMDPHVWLSPKNAIRIAQNIRVALCGIDAAHAAGYQARYDRIAAELERCDRQLSEVLGPFKGRSFYVYHPAFGYFAQAASLKQIAVELGGRNVSGTHLAEIIRRAGKENVRVIFVQPQFNPNSARALAMAIRGEVVELDPLAADLPRAFRTMTETLRKGLERK